MNDLFSKPQISNSTLCEIEISYKPKIKASERAKVITSSDAESVLRQAFPSLEHREYFYALYLNRANAVLGYCQISSGGMAGTVMDQRLIFQTALKCNACSIVVAHNHPSGNTRPSEADKEITNKLKQSGKYLDLPILDHLILTDEHYFSFADEGLM